MKKIISSALAVFLILGSFSVFAGCGERREDVLKVFNTADYIALGDKETEGVVRKFENYYRQKTNNSRFKVVYETFDTNEIAISKIEKNKEDWDLVNISDYAVEKLQKANLLKKIDISSENMPDYANVSNYIKGKYSEITGLDNINGDETYAVGYMWGTMGLLYNKALSEDIDETVKSWSALWNESFRDKVLMKNSVRDSYAIALLYSHKEELLALKGDSEGYNNLLSSLFSQATEQTIASAEAALLLQKELVNVRYEVDDGKDDIATGRGFMLSLAWSGDAAYAMSEAADGVELAYTIPEEGSNVWFDGWVTPIYGKNHAAAEAFINFLCNPEIAIMNMEETGYTSVIATQETFDWFVTSAYDNELEYSIDVTYFFGDMMGAEGANINPVYIADISDIERCGIMKDFGSQTENVISMWTRVKGSSISPFVYAFVIAVVIAAVILLVMMSIKKNNRNKKRKAYNKIRK